MEEKSLKLASLSLSRPRNTYACTGEGESRHQAKVLFDRGFIAAAHLKETQSNNPGCLHRNHVGCLL